MPMLVADCSLSRQDELPTEVHAAINLSTIFV
jgi:hypothetical protein